MTIYEKARLAAEKKGQTHYLGVKCKCGSRDRFVKTKECVNCKTERNKRYDNKNPEVITVKGWCLL